MSTTIARPSRARRNAFTLAATLAVAASAITIPLVAQPAQAASTGCNADLTTLQIQKTDPAGQPLSGAVFQVDAQHWATNYSLGENFAQNPISGEYNAADVASAQAYAARDAAQAVLADAQAAQADAQAALDALLAEAGEQSPELAALYALESEQSIALFEAQETLGLAEEALLAAEWGGDADEIAEAQAAVDAAQQVVDEGLAELVEIRAKITELEAAGPSAEEIAAARAALEAATAATKEASVAATDAEAAATLAGQASSALWLDAFEQVTPTTVTTDEAGQATVEVVRYAHCNPNDVPEGVRNFAEVIAPVVSEIEAPSGFVRDSTPYTATWEGSEDDGGWTVTVVNSPEEPEGPEEPERSEEPEDPAAPIEPPKPDVPLVQTGSDLTAPITTGAMIAALGAAVAAIPLLRRIRAKRA